MHSTTPDSFIATHTNGVDMFTKSLKMMTASCCLIFATTQTFAQEEASFPIGRITQLNALYTSPQGDGSAKEVSIEGFGDFINPKLEVENYNGILMFRVENEAFELDLSSLPIRDANKIDLDNINYTNGNADLSLGLTNINATGEGFRTTLTNSRVQCQKREREGSEYEQLLQNCFNYLTLNVDKAYFKSDERSFYNVTNEYETLGDAVEIDGISLNIRNGKFNGHLKGNISKGVKVKFEGRSSYDLDNKIINIKIEKAKAGFFNVRRTIFKELERFESNTIEVDEPNIYIILQD